mmetsp:Transcript_9881/g.27660  ORF Transcript_9881/g.27660 Transcript_9881/m.27660 type:complete len:253 (+) Transcript_9881:2827-3585(+)
MRLTSSAPTAGTNFLLLLLLNFLSACIFLVHADDEVDPCIALQERTLKTYSSPGCAYARTVVSEGDAMAGETPPDPIVCTDGYDDGLSCVANVTQITDGFVEYGCSPPDPVEEIHPFMWLVNDNYLEFIKSTQFYCNRDDCYSIVRDTLEADCGDVLDSPGSNSLSYTECFRWIPCGCVRAFAITFEESGPDFVEDFGPPGVIADAAAEAFDKGVCDNSDAETPTSGGGFIAPFHSFALMSLGLGIFVLFVI